MDQTAEFAEVDRLVSKGAIAVRARLLQRSVDGISQDIFSDEELTDMLQDYIKDGRWVDTMGVVLLLWSRDWSRFLGRDFVRTGDGPEYYIPTGV